MGLVLDVSRRNQWCLRGILFAEVAAFAAAISPTANEVLGAVAAIALIFWIPTAILAFAPRGEQLEK